MQKKILRVSVSYIKNFLPSILKDFLGIHFNLFRNESFSQEGEDLILERLFSTINYDSNGFYIDIGAHHPVRFSNTYLFYKKGWKGINIDAMPGSMKAFNFYRPNDINIEIPISDKEEELIYYIFNEPALNGFDKNISLKRDAEVSNNFFIESKKIIKTMTATQIFDAHIPDKKNIDFISIDIEGYDIKVLKSIDLNKYSPKVILIEILNNKKQDFLNNSINNFLNKNKYCLYARTVNTSIYIKNEIFDSIKNQLA